MDSDEFEEVVRSLWSPIRAYLVGRVPRDQVDDVLQETFSSMWVARPKMPATERERNQLRALAFRLAERRAADLWRAQARHQRRLRRVHELSRDEAAPSSVDCLLSQIPPAWLFELPTDALEVLVRFADGHSVAEIADDLGISPNAVSSRLKRIRSKVKSLIRESEAVGT